MHDLRIFMKTASDAVAAEFAHHGKTLGFGKGLNGVANITKRRARLDHTNALPHGFIRDVNQALRQHARFTRDIHAAGVAMKTVFNHRDVNIENIAVFQHFVARNTVTNHMVDGNAGGFGKRRAAIAETGGLHAMLLAHVIVAEAIQFAGGNAGGDVRANHVQYISGDSAGSAHGNQVGSGFQDNGHMRRDRSAW